MFYFEATFNVIGNEKVKQCKLIKCDYCGLGADDYSMCDVWQSAISQAYKILENDFDEIWELDTVEFLGC